MLIGIDFGLKRIGIAIADESTGIVVPIKTIKNDRNSSQTVTQIIRSYNVNKIICGISQTGVPETQSNVTKQTKLFINNLAKMCGINEIVYVNEFLTTAVIKGKRKKDLDAECASLVLHDYLSNREFYENK